jgi:hypothetical protein
MTGRSTDDGMYVCAICRHIFMVSARAQQASCGAPETQSAAFGARVEAFAATRQPADVAAPVTHAAAELHRLSSASVQAGILAALRHDRTAVRQERHQLEDFINGRRTRLGEAFRQRMPDFEAAVDALKHHHTASRAALAVARRVKARLLDVMASARSPAIHSQASFQAIAAGVAVVAVAAIYLILSATGSMNVVSGESNAVQLAGISTGPMDATTGARGADNATAKGAIGYANEPWQTRFNQGGEGELLVTSVPPGARVTVNGVGWGVTPLTIRHLPLGEKRVRLSKEGHVSAERAVWLTSTRRAVRMSLRRGDVIQMASMSGGLPPHPVSTD